MELNNGWVARYDGPGEGDFSKGLVLDEEGNVYVTGASNAGVDPDREDFDFTTIKYNKKGKEVWVRRLGEFGADPSAITIDKVGNIYVTGSTALGERDDEYTTVKYDADGNEQWVASFNPPGFSVNEALSIAVDALQNVYVAGRSASGPEEENFDYVTVKYNASGQEVWVRRYNGPANGDDEAISLALDGQGNVYVTGRSLGIGSGFDFATVKYNTAGVEQWVTRYNGPGNGADGPRFSFFSVPRAIAVDHLGNVYVTGPSEGIGTGFDYATIKYSQFACGKKGDKVMICHKGKSLCINKSDVSAHLNHGDQLGACPVPPYTVTGRIDQPAAGNNSMPASFKVAVAPNPAGITTKIFYDLPVEGWVSIQVFDMLGKEITTLVDAAKQAGFHNAEFNVAALQKGMYYYRITVKTAKEVWSQTGKINVVK